MRRLFFGNLLVGIVAFAIVLIAVEAAIRTVGHYSARKQTWSDRPKRNYLPERVTRYRDYPYSISIPPEDVFRIAVIGDSFTYAGKIAFTDSFPKRLEQMFSLNPKAPRTEVLKLGVPGYSTALESQLANAALERYHADVLVLQVTLNDAAFETTHFTFAKSEKAWNKVRSKFLFKHWKTYAFFSDTASQSRNASAVKNLLP